MKLAIDLDGVCYEWQRTYRYMMREYRDVHMPPVEEFWNYWNACDQYTTRADRDWIWDEGVRLGLFRYGHVVSGAIIGLKALYEQGHKLIVVTHRPPNAVRDTLDFVSYLASNLWDWSGVHILTNSEPKVQVKADVLVDDKPENVIEWAGTGRKAIVFDQPWNRGIEPRAGIVRAHGWGEVVRYARELSD